MTTLTLAPAFSPDDVRRSIDGLVGDALRYRSTKDFGDLLRFAARFRSHKPFNALLIHAQMPGARFVAPAHKWRDKFGRTVKYGERPIVALQPFGPVMFVYDVSQTESLEGELLPAYVVNAFEMRPVRGVDRALPWTIENAKRWGVRFNFTPQGSQSAGHISWIPGTDQTVTQNRRTGATDQVPVQFQSAINESFNDTERYATIVHELAHLFCGHLGTPNDKWWPNRRGLSKEVREFEAESVAYLVCQRLDANVQMPPYLDGYLDHGQVPEGISLEQIMTVAGKLIDLGRKTVRPEK